MNGWCPSAPRITAHFTGSVTRNAGGRKGASIRSDMPGYFGGPRDSARRHSRVTIWQARTKNGRRSSTQRHAKQYLEHADWHELNSQEQNSQEALVNRARSGRSRPRWLPPDSCGFPSGFCYGCQVNRFRIPNLEWIASLSLCGPPTPALLNTAPQFPPELPGRTSFGFR